MGMILRCTTQYGEKNTNSVHVFDRYYHYNDRSTEHWLHLHWIHHASQPNESSNAKSKDIIYFRAAWWCSRLQCCITAVLHIPGGAITRLGCNRWGTSLAWNTRKKRRIKCWTLLLSVYILCPYCHHCQTEVTAISFITFSWYWVRKKPFCCFLIFVNVCEGRLVYRVRVWFCLLFLTLLNPGEITSCLLPVMFLTVWQ